MKKTQDLTMKQVVAASKPHWFPRFSQCQQWRAVLTSPERRILGGLLGILFLSLATLGGWFVTTHRIDTPTTGGSYTEGLIGEPIAINPLYAQANDVDADLTALVYSGLVRWNGEDAYVPDLADSMQRSDDGRTYTFHLRDGIRFHNGTPVQVRDILFTISAIQNPAYRSPLAPSFRGVRVEQVDDKTVSFTLEKAFAPFLSALAVGILPSDVWGDIDPAHASLAAINLSPIGSGPYRFNRYEKDESGFIKKYTLKRFTDFYRSPAHIDEFIFKFYSDATAAEHALENKNVEGVSYIPSELEQSVSSLRHTSIHTPDFPRITALFFNQNSSTLLKKKEVRQAIQAALNKDEILGAALFGRGRIINDPFLPGQSGVAVTSEAAVFDPGKAMELLDVQKLLKKEGEEIRTYIPAGQKEPVALQLTLTTVQNNEFIRAAEQIKEQLKKVGIAIMIEPVDLSEFFSKVIAPHDYELLLYGQLLGADPDPYPFWHSSQITSGRNLAQFSSRQADDILIKAQGLTDAAERGKLYADFQTILAQEIPAVFLYQSFYAYSIGSSIEGPTVNRLISPSDRFGRVNEWYVKTSKQIQWPWL